MCSHSNPGFPESSPNAVIGGKHIATEMQRLLVQAVRTMVQCSAGGHHPLRKRELQIVNLIVAWPTRQESTEKLFVSPDTVEIHLWNILHKLDCRNTTGLVNYTMERWSDAE